MKINSVVHRYFEQHPAAKDGVLKAWYAYHAPHFRLLSDLALHNFTNGSRESKCVWCGRTRELVRHDDQPPQCGRRPVIREIEEVLREEEEHALTLVASARTDATKFVAKMGMSGETLAVLHHTYGHDPETVAAVMDVPAKVLSDYHSAMDKERARSRAAQKRAAVTR